MIRAILLFSLVIGSVGVSGTTLTVCETCDFQTLRQAVQMAQRHDTLSIKKGTYPCENLELIRPIHLMGEEGAVLDGNGEGYIIKILSDSVSVSGLKFINSGRSYTKDFAAIYSFRAHHFVISNNVIIDPFFGMLIEKSKDGLIQGNVIYGLSKKEDDSGNGIHLWHCSDVTIDQNDISDLRDGIYLEFVENSVIRQNYSHNNVRYGLHFMFSNHNQYLENTFEKNGAGVAVMFSKWIVMHRNRFLHNWGTASYGLLLKEIYDAEVTENEFSYNTIGIYIDGCTRINYVGNRLTQNGWAIKVSGGCYANSFSHNNFTGNSFDVSYNSKLNDNSFNDNFWSEYTGYDLNKDGIGDVPYRPVKLFSYIVHQTPESIVLLRSLFVDLINFSEKVAPVFTPDDLIDVSPSMNPFQ